MGNAFKPAPKTTLSLARILKNNTVPMTAKKIFGYIFIVMSVILTLAIVGQIQRLFQETFGFFKVFTGTLDTYESTKAITKFVFWILHFTIVIVLWTYGRKWTKRTITT
jgi:hypothetical protein